SVNAGSLAMSIQPTGVNVNAWSTMPGANEALPISVPLRPPAMSSVLPSPGHQLTRASGGGVQLVAAVAGPAAKLASRIAPADSAWFVLRILLMVSFSSCPTAGGRGPGRFARAPHPPVE